MVLLLNIISSFLEKILHKNPLETRFSTFFNILNDRNVFFYSEQTIMSLNNLSNETIYPGQKLRLLVSEAQRNEESFYEDSIIKELLESDPNSFLESFQANQIGVFLGFEEIYTGEFLQDDGLKGEFFS